MDAYQAEQIATAQLDGGERLLWSGVPRPGRSARLALPLGLFGIPFAGFAAFWTWSAYRAVSHGSAAGGPGALFPLFGLPFLLIGAGMLTAPLGVWLAATRTVYAVTERRAMIIERMGATSVQSWRYEDMDELQRVERADGSGDLFFATRTRTGQRGVSYRTRIGFLGIPDVRSVEQLLQGHQERIAA
jgi:hypothetical protein